MKLGFGQDLADSRVSALSIGPLSFYYPESLLDLAPHLPHAKPVSGHQNTVRGQNVGLSEMLAQET